MDFHDACFICAWMSFRSVLVMKSLHYSSCCGPVHSCIFFWDPFSCSWFRHLTTLIYCHAAGSAWTMCSSLPDQKWHVVFTCAIHFRVFCLCIAFIWVVVTCSHFPSLRYAYVLHHIRVWSALLVFARLCFCFVWSAWLWVPCRPRPGIFHRVVIN